MPVGRGDRDPDPAARLREREATDAAFCDQLDRSVDERGPQIAVVIAAALAGAIRSDS
jgi:hypothetical protein